MGSTFGKDQFALDPLLTSCHVTAWTLKTFDFVAMAYNSSPIPTLHFTAKCHLKTAKQGDAHANKGQEPGTMTDDMVQK